METETGIYRAYDIRGKMGEELNPELYFQLGQAYAKYLHSRNIKLCPVGRDNRHHSQEFSQKFISGLNYSGIDSIDLGVAPIALVYFASYHLDTPAAAMITSSHLPKDTNGLKLNRDFSEPLSHDEILGLKKTIDSSDFVFGEGKNTQKDLSVDYIDQIKGHFSELKKLKIVVDGLNGGAGKIYAQALQALGQQVIDFNLEPNPDFPLGTPDPLETIHMNRLSEKVIASSADLGVSFDADGDRLGVVDNLGNPISMSQLLSLLSIKILEQYPHGYIVYNNLCSPVLPHTIERFGGYPVLAKTGRSFVKTAIAKHDAVFGGEYSGHIFFPRDFYGHDDPLFACGYLLSLLSEKQLPLSQLLQELETYLSSPEIKIYINNPSLFSWFKNNSEIFKKHLNLYVTSDEDGYSFSSKNDYVVIRPSQNGPYFTIRFDSKTQEGYQSLKAAINQMIKELPEIDLVNSVNTSALS